MGEDYLDAGDGMLICMKRRKKRGPNPPRKACRGPEKTVPAASNASDIQHDPELTREACSLTPHSSHAPPSPPPSPETTRPSRPGSFPFHWMWEHVSVKGQAMYQGAPPEKAKKKKSPLASSSSVREPPCAPQSSPGATAAKETRCLEGARPSAGGSRPCCSSLAPRGSLLSLCWTMEARSEARKRQLRQERKRWLHLTQQLLSLEQRCPKQEKCLPGKQLEERLRAEMLCLAAAPEEPCPQAERRGAKAGARPGQEGLTFQPAINRRIPDFKNLQRRFQEQLERKKDQAKVTVCKPFRLHSASGSQPLSGEEDKGCQEDPFCEVWRVRWRARSCPDFGLPTVPPVMPTKASDKRQEANRLLLLEWERRERQEKRRAELRRDKEQRVQRQVAKCLAAYRTPGQPSAAFQRRREELRRLERQRMEEYSLQLQKMHNRVENRPYLFERVMQENARQAVQRRFSQVLAALGISEEMLWKQAVRPSSGRSSARSTHKRTKSPESLQEQS
ncbi:testis-specific protein 10-interacting protein isoform X2 [Varanus komodoensis]|uniref:testis-specific protein 10-interacting protein isoform X2 n=1 Tax=Varanus komodoensis TaxID=61221 RepID=UPI001CF77AB9|nr:testis-specific protein 10-interacting protein isoform X2 [Varanus komodoensis]